MNIDSTIVIKTVIGILIWVVLGAANDLTKILFKTLGSYLSFLPGMMASTSKKAGKAVKAHIDDDTKYEITSQFVSSIKNFFGNVKLSLQAWAKHYQAQVTEEEPTNVLTNNNLSENLITIQAPIGVDKPEAKYSGQKIIGAIIELICLLGFLYADAAQAAQTFSVLFPKATIPAFLNDIIVPLIVASAGTAFILGIFIGDMLGLTHLSFWGKLQGKKKTVVLVLMILNLTVSITLSTLVALYRADIINTNNVHSQLIYTLARNAQSLVIAPMLITTALLIRGVFGLFILLSIILYVASLPFAFFEYFTDILSKLIAGGAISIDFVFSRILLLGIGVTELVFSLLKLIIEGSFLSLIIFWAIIFYIPYIIVNTLMKRFTGNNLLEHFKDLDGFKLVPPTESGEGINTETLTTK